METHMTSLDSFKCARTLKVGTKTFLYYSLPVAEKNGVKGIFFVVTKKVLVVP